MHIGKMRQQINIEQQTSTPDSQTGDPVASWTTFAANQWARVQSLTGEEVFKIGQVMGTEMFTITMRYLPGLNKSTMRVNFGGTLMEIVSVSDVDARHREHDLMVRVVNNI